MGQRHNQKDTVFPVKDSVFFRSIPGRAEEEHGDVVDIGAGRAGL